MLQAGNISSDGRYIAFTDWERGAAGGDPNLLGSLQLAVYDTQTGRSRLLTERAAEYDGYVDAAVWSADGERLAYTKLDTDIFSLHVINADGSNDHVLRSFDDGLEQFFWPITCIYTNRRPNILERKTS